MSISLPMIASSFIAETATIGEGNTKLGADIHTWSIPPIHTCPGSSELCRDLCYGTEGFYRYFSNDRVLYRNWIFSQRADFPTWIGEKIRRMKIRIFRVHGVGDFYSPDYASKWLDVMDTHRHVTFFLFSRSHTVPTIAPYLESMSTLPNAYIWYSLDRHMQIPSCVPPRVRLAYMLTDQETEIPEGIDLAFRDDAHLRGQVLKKIRGVQICPYEQGVERQVRITCSKCKWCFTL